MVQMSCEDWFELVSAAADDQLSTEETARLDAHLEHCASCRDLLGSFTDQRRRARLQRPTSHPELADAVLRHRSQQRQRHASAERHLARRGVAAAAATIAAVVALSTMTGPDRDRPPTSTLETATSAEVLIDAGNHTFDAETLEVPAGTTVEWRNAGTTTHHLVRHVHGATIDDDLSPGHSESITFGEAGTYEFWCTIHPEMAGAVTVDA